MKVSLRYLYLYKAPRFLCAAVVAVSVCGLSSCSTVGNWVKPITTRVNSIVGGGEQTAKSESPEGKSATEDKTATQEDRTTKQDIKQAPEKTVATAPEAKKASVSETKNAAAAKDHVASKPERKKKSKKQKEAAQAIEAAVMPTAPSTLGKDIEGEWVIVAAGAKVISRDEDMPYLTFAGGEHRFYGSNGCNVINGAYSVEGDRITFSEVLSTMMYCPDTDFDAAISAVLADGKTVGANVKRIGNESYLYMTNETGKALLTLCRHNMSFLNGNWVVTQINGNAVSDDECNIFFDISELKVHGNTGCNFFNGTIMMDPEGANSINFSGMGVTHKMCPNADRERMMLVALEEATTAVAGENNDTAILLDDSGRQVLTLRRAPMTRNAQE